MTAQIVIGVILLLIILMAIFIRRKSIQMAKIVDILSEYRPKIAAAKTSEELKQIEKEFNEIPDLRKLIYYYQMEQLWWSMQNKFDKLIEQEKKKQNDGARSL